MKSDSLRHFSAVAAAAFGLLSASAFADPVIVNGSFESPAYGAVGVYSGGGDGWTKSFEGPVSIINGNIKDNYGRRYGATEFGVQYLGLDPRTSTGFGSADSQTIPGFVVGQKYVLSLYVADSDGGLAPQLQVTLSNDMGHNYLVRQFDVPVGGPYGNHIQFTRTRVLFTSKVTGAITLSLANTGTGSDPGSITIDNVHLRVATAADIASIPETATTDDATDAVVTKETIESASTTTTGSSRSTSFQSAQ